MSGERRNKKEEAKRTVAVPIALVDPGRTAAVQGRPI